MIDIFQKDSQRYALERSIFMTASKARGILSAWWADRYIDTGADLVETWRGTLPDEDMMVIGSVIQHGGVSALPDAFKEVARMTKVMDEARKTFLSIMFTGFIAVLVVLAMLVAIPLFIWPRLQQTFDFLPQEMYGERALSMAHFADVMPGYLGAAICLGLLASAAFRWSLPHWTGPLRAWCDHHLIVYRLARDFRGAMFVSTLSALIRKRTGSNMILADAVQVISREAKPWMQWYCEQILDNIQQGQEQAEVLDVGLLERETLFYLLDITDARGLDEGLQVAGLRTEKSINASVKVRARVLQIALLSAMLLTVGAISGWTTATINEFVDVTKLFYQQ